MDAEARARFWQKVHVIPCGGCWEWTASRAPNGYGQFRSRRYPDRTKQAHRLAYEMQVGPIPEGLDIDHLCRNRACVNPGHLEPVTRSENLQRGRTGDHLRKAQKAKTHCPQGHPYDGSNLTVYGKGWRKCKACGREAARRYRARRSA